MTNELMLKTLLDRYEELSFAEDYIIGFPDRGVVYVTICKANLLPLICTLDKASSKTGGGYSIRFKPTKNQKEVLKMQDSTFVLCSEEFLESEFKNCKYNRGEVFEKLITEYYGQSWKKDCVKFTEDGDITIANIPYQIKYNKATFASESLLLKLKA